MTTLTMNRAHTTAAVEPQETMTTTCAIVGGGPAGAVLALLLARQGIDVTLLEKFSDFDRDFRGDTIHPSTLDLLDQMGLAERVLAIPHGELRAVAFSVPGGMVKLAEFKDLKVKYPFIAMVPQSDFIDFLVAEAQQYPNFHLHMSATVHELIEEGGTVRGLTYDDRAGRHELRALLTVGADGRFSKVRHLLSSQSVKAAGSVDIVWFRLPRLPEDGEMPLGSSGPGVAVVCLPRPSDWQLGYILLKGSYKDFQAQGVEHLQAEVAHYLPPLAGRVKQLTDWKQVAFLSVESSRVKQWWRPGVLLLGDAAHVMSPIGGVGINYAIQDAVVAANILSQPLKWGRVTDYQLALVQQQREWPTKVIQTFQQLAQERILKASLTAGQSVQIPWPLRLPIVGKWLGRKIAHLIAYGPRKVTLKVGRQADETIARSFVLALSD